MLAKSKLSSLENLVSKTLIDLEISPDYQGETKRLEDEGKCDENH